jgi:hypothetical protein
LIIEIRRKEIMMIKTLRELITVSHGATINQELYKRLGESASVRFLLGDMYYCLTTMQYKNYECSRVVGARGGINVVVKIKTICPDESSDYDRVSVYVDGVLVVRYSTTNILSDRKKMGWLNIDYVRVEDIETNMTYVAGIYQWVVDNYDSFMLDVNESVDAVSKILEVKGIGE